MRAFKFAKYLPRYGWRPVVLCGGGFRYLAEDETLIPELPTEVAIERVDVPEPYSLASRRPSPKTKEMGRGIASWLSFPDTRALWITRGLRRGLEIIKKENPSVILATSPPYSSLILGRKLSERTGLPLVVDYRDLWNGSPYRAYPTRFHAIWNQKAEARVLRRASSAIVINEVMGRILSESFGIRPFVIHQGYDPADFSGQKPPEDGCLRILYAGSFFGKRDPTRFLDGLALVKQRRPELCFTLTWAGIGSYPVEEMIRSRGFSDVFQHIPYTSHRASCRLMEEHNLLWALVGPEEGPEVSTVKAYDYLGARRALLVAAPENTDAARLARETGSYLCPPDDPEAVYWAVCQIYDDLRRKSLRVPKNTEKYSAPVRTKALADLLSGLT
ncbi:MAG: glycosyltransferase [candidate division WOR-3 bacterium]